MRLPDSGGDTDLVETEFEAEDLSECVASLLPFKIDVDEQRLLFPLFIGIINEVRSWIAL